MIRLKRVYDSPEATDGRRVLTERLWPRGISKERAALDYWLKDIAPSPELRQWFSHDPAKWDEFRRRYFAELDGDESAVAELRGLMRKGDVTLIYAAKDTLHNASVALKEYLEKTDD